MRIEHILFTVLTEDDVSMNTYIFHWADGTIDEGKGVSVADAFTRLGFGAGAMPALDHWEEK